MSKVVEYQYTIIKSFRTNKIQKNTLDKLKNKYKIDISHFIRDAIKEKIDREYVNLQDKIKIKDVPF